MSTTQTRVHDIEAYRHFEAGYQDRLNGLPPSVGISDAYWRGYCERIVDEIAAESNAA